MSEAQRIDASSDSSSHWTAIDDALRRLSAQRATWVATSLPERIHLLQQTLARVVEIAPEWVRTACVAKGVDPDSPLAGEEWISGPMATVRSIRLFIEALLQRGAPRPASITSGPGGRTIARVFPHRLIERVAYSGLSAEVWIPRGSPASQGRVYREKAAGRFGPGALSLVLGAGNISSIGPLDVLYRLVALDEVVALKMNPVNSYLAPFLERGFAPFVERGFVAVFTGGKDVGEYLAHHPLIESLHLTGSDRTYDAIVWGATPEEQRRNRERGTPRLDKPFTAELGCITPVIVLPGRWSAGDLRFQAEHVASMVAHNASFNCNAGKLLVLPRAWEQRGAFLEQLADAMRRMPPRVAYYPGAHERWRRFLEHYPAARVLGARPSEAVVPWTLITGVEPRPGEYALRNEAFCGVLAEVSLPGDGVSGFLSNAVRFVNDEVWGTLSCVLIVHPSARRGHEPEIEQAIADLRYGSVGVNVWTGANFAFGSPSWGAYPGHTREHIVSGTGVVHNAFLFDHPEKSVMRGPFRLRPKPIWFANHRTLHAVGPALVRFEAHPHWRNLPKLAFEAARG